MTARMRNFMMVRTRSIFPQILLKFFYYSILTIKLHSDMKTANLCICSENNNITQSRKAAKFNLLSRRGSCPCKICDVIKFDIVYSRTYNFCETLKYLFQIRIIIFLFAFLASWRENYYPMIGYIHFLLIRCKIQNNRIHSAQLYPVTEAYFTAALYRLFFIVDKCAVRAAFILKPDPAVCLNEYCTLIF
jgi:hypothetical protein